MPRKRVYSSATARAESHDSRLRRSGGLVVSKVRLSPEVAVIVNTLIESGRFRSIAAVLNAAVLKFTPDDG